jgi:hypothetical protein
MHPQGHHACATVRAAITVWLSIQLDIRIVLTTIHASLRPPEGLGVRLASAGPFLFGARVSLALSACLLVSCSPNARIDSRMPASAGEAMPFAPGIRVDRARQLVIIEGTVALTQGFLEQLVCTPSTRVHESLIAIDAAPREVHAAMLLAGLEPGEPGTWQEAADPAGGWRVDRVRPTGPRVDVSARWPSPEGDVREMPLLSWVRRVSASGDPSMPAVSESQESPQGQLVFAGSRIRRNSPSMGPGEHYVADFTGSVVGLVTFGDEVIAYDEVIADRVDVDAAVWVAWTERIPPEGTRVELLIRAHGLGR